MTLSRRNTMKLLGGGMIAALGAGAYKVTRLPQVASAPWQVAGQFDDPRMKALSYAILSPNPHNRQPWMVDISTPDQITLYVDTDRMLPHTDPFNRQITIGLGCFLETLTLAAAEDGIGVKLDLFPQGEDAAGLDGRPVAVVQFQGEATPDPLFQHVLDRRTQKEPYDLTREVPDDALALMQAACIRGTQTGGSNDLQVVEALRELSAEALSIEIETPRTLKESVDLFRIGHAEVDASPDGIALTGPMIETISSLGMFSRAASLDPNSSAYAQGLAAVLRNANSAMAHVWQVTKGNSRRDQIIAGRDWLRLHLAATGAGVALQPLSQALQEYEEMAGPYADIHKMLAPEGGTVQMFARLGYCAPVPPSPRWPIEDKILNG